jgi:hypothetical protein
MPTAHPLTAARIGELLRLQIILEQPDLTPFDLRLYLADRLDDLYPLDYLVYVRRWRGLAPGAEPEPLLGFLEWWPLVAELTERAAVAEMIGEGDELSEGIAAGIGGGGGSGAGVARPGSAGAPPPQRHCVYYVVRTDKNVDGMALRFYRLLIYTLELC